MFYLLFILKNLPGILMEGLPFLGEEDPIAFSPEKRKLAGFFEKLDLGTHGRLSNIEFLSCLGEVHILGNMIENSELVEIEHELAFLVTRNS
jgi:hypothetical protein